MTALGEFLAQVLSGTSIGDETDGPLSRITDLLPPRVDTKDPVLAEFLNESIDPEAFDTAPAPKWSDEELDELWDALIDRNQRRIQEAHLGVRAAWDAVNDATESQRVAQELLQAEKDRATNLTPWERL